MLTDVSFSFSWKLLQASIQFPGSAIVGSSIHDPLHWLEVVPVQFLDDLFVLWQDVGRPKDRDRERRRNNGRGQGRAKEVSEKDSKTKQERKDPGVEDKEKAKDKDSGDNEPDIKVKSLEEILREKALKKLEERRAENKARKESEGNSDKPAPTETTDQQSSTANGIEELVSSQEAVKKPTLNDSGGTHEGVYYKVVLCLLLSLMKNVI